MYITYVVEKASLKPKTISSVYTDEKQVICWDNFVTRRRRRRINITYAVDKVSFTRIQAGSLLLSACGWWRYIKFVLPTLAR
jgi:hypothetical protein